MGFGTVKIAFPSVKDCVMQLPSGNSPSISICVAGFRRFTNRNYEGSE